MSTEPKSNPSGNDTFAKTRWSLVLEAGRRSSADSRQALESLCDLYWYPLYGYARRRVANRSEAEDLTQGFFAELLEKNYVAAATPERGRFRAFLLTAFRNFMSKQWEKARAQKRGGERAPIPLDFDSADSRFSLEPVSSLTAEQFYDRQWAVALLGRTMERTARVPVRADKEGQYHELKGFIIGEHPGTSYHDVAARLNTGRRRQDGCFAYAADDTANCFATRLWQTASTPQEIDDEIRNLFAALEWSIERRHAVTIPSFSVRRDSRAIMKGIL